MSGALSMGLLRGAFSSWAVLDLWVRHSSWRLMLPIYKREPILLNLANSWDPHEDRENRHEGILSVHIMPLNQSLL